MYWFDVQKHKLPHIHVRYQGAEAVFTLDGKWLEGRASSRVRQLILSWCSERRVEIEIAWEQAVAGKEIPWVHPLQ